MTNIREKQRLSRETKNFLLHGIKKGQSVGLSNCPNLTESRGEIALVHVKQFRNGEGYARICYDKSKNRLQIPPRHEGERIHKNGLSMKAKSKVKRSARILSDIATQCKVTKAFITLSYGKDFPDDKTAKKHLDVFFKRMKRLLTKTNELLITLWVAEKQKRGAIHFHILNLSWIAKEDLNFAWNGIVQKWQKQNGFPIQKVMPNIKNINYPAGYLAKYLSKGGEEIRGNLYGMSTMARVLCKPISEMNYRFNEDFIELILAQAIEKSKIKESTFFISNGNNKPKLIWSKENIQELSKRLNYIQRSLDYGK